MNGAAIKTRRDLARHLQAQMAAARFSWPMDADEAEATGRTHVKTYLIEAHAVNGDRAARADLLARVAAPLRMLVAETEDPDLVCLRNQAVELWCDWSTPRYWRLHTVAKVKDADDMVEELVGSSPWLDSVWLPPYLLEALPEQTSSEMQTFSLQHDRRPLHAAESRGREFEYVSLRLWASRAAETLTKLRRSDILPQGVSLRSVRVRSDVKDETNDFCVAEYFHHGKVTATGTSFEEHARLLAHVVRSYQGVVERIEQEFGLGYQENPTRLKGKPVVIEMEWTVDDLNYAVRRMFDAVPPFRLWGLPELVGNNHYRVRAVDLHVGSVLTFDITPTHVVVQLPEGACGNTVVRFLGNLQYHVNADARSPVFG